MASDPFSDLFSGVGDFFNDLFGGGAATTESTFEWNPWENDGRIETPLRSRPIAPPPPPPQGSVRQYLRQTVGPRITREAPPTAKAFDGLLQDDRRGKLIYDRLPSEGDQKKGRGKLHKGGTWTQSNATWKSLNNYEKAAAMALLEADAADPDIAKNALASMINRASKNEFDLGQHVSSRAYQPSFEPAQERRLNGVLKKPAFATLASWAQSYSEGNEDDPTDGATHFLAKPSVMLALEAREPSKYRSWRSWTGYSDETGQYRGTTFIDRSHHFLAPEGRFTVKRNYK